MISSDRGVASASGQNLPNPGGRITAIAKINSGALSPRSGIEFQTKGRGERDTQDRHIIKRQSL